MGNTDQKYKEVYEQAYARLDEIQRTAVDHIEGPVMVIGGPGTGKTQVLCMRMGNIAMKSASAPGSILCLTNREDSVNAIRRRLLTIIGPDAYLVNVYSFESFCGEIIRDNPFVLHDLSINQSSEWERKFWFETGQVKRVLSAFEKDNNLLAVYQEKYRYILIDEYEDTLEIQNRLVTLLTANSEKPNLFVTGDDDQAIYRQPESRFAAFARYSKHLFTVVFKNNYRPTPKPVIREYETWPEEIIDITSQVQQFISEGIAPHKIAVIYRDERYAEQLGEHLRIKNLPVYSRHTVNILEIPLIKKILRIPRYLAAELDLPYSGDNLLFEILHFDFFDIPPIEIARVAVEVNELKRQGALTSLRKVLHDKINTPPKTLFDIPLHPALAKASRSLEMMIGEAANVHPQMLLEKVIRDSGVFAYIRENNSRPRLFSALTTLLDFVQEETLRSPGLDLSHLLDSIKLMQQNRMPLSMLTFTGTGQGVHLLSVEDCKGMEFEHVFLAGCNASAWDKMKDPSPASKQPDVFFSSVEPGNDDERNGRMFYVAITRARRFLNLSFAKSGNHGKLLDPSRFIIEILRQGTVKVQQHTTDKEAVAEFEKLQFREQAPRIEDTSEEFVSRLVSNFVMSVSALNNYLRCPLEFYFKNIIRLPAGKSEAAEFGSAIHFAIQRLFEKMKADPREQFPSIQEMIADFTWYMNSHLAWFTREGFNKRLEHGKIVLTNYYAEYIDTWPRIVAVELNIRNVVWKGVPLKGKVDKLEFNGKDVNVVDYKSGDLEKARLMLTPPSDQLPDGGDYWRQAVFYKILVDQYGGKGWKATSSEIDFVEPAKNGQYEKCKITIRPEDIETVSQQIVQVWERVQQHDFYRGCGKEGCYWCTLVKN